MKSLVSLGAGYFFNLVGIRLYALFHDIVSQELAFLNSGGVCPRVLLHLVFLQGLESFLNIPK